MDIKPIKSQAFTYIVKKNIIQTMKLENKKSAILKPVILPDGYHGKILLLSVTGGATENTVILRSGDLWHSEILRETQEEIKDLGLSGSEAYPMGGAWARFENDGSIIIWGTSDQFGACDKEAAAKLIKIIYPDRDIRIEY